MQRPCSGAARTTEVSWRGIRTPRRRPRTGVVDTAVGPEAAASTAQLFPRRRASWERGAQPSGEPSLIHESVDEGGLSVRVLVVEDETQLADAVARGLRREGMAVD